MSGRATWEPVDPPDAAPAPADEELVVRSRVRPWMRAVLAAAVALAVAYVAIDGWLDRRHHEDVARSAARVAVVQPWLADDREWGVNTNSSNTIGNCRDIDGQQADPPEERLPRLLEQQLPGFRYRGVVRTIDAAGQLCMVQVRVAQPNAGGAVVVLRVEPPWDQAVTADDGRPVVDDSTSVVTGYVAAAAADGWTVVVAWSGDAADLPGYDVLGALARGESARW